MKGGESNSILSIFCSYLSLSGAAVLSDSAGRGTKAGPPHLYMGECRGNPVGSLFIDPVRSTVRAHHPLLLGCELAYFGGIWSLLCLEGMAIQ